MLTEYNNSAVIFDIDGVLADSWHRRRYIHRAKPDWDGFFDACDGDPALPLVELVPLLEDGVTRVFYVTGRPRRTFQKTRVWLERNVPGAVVPRLIMRPDRMREPLAWKCGMICRVSSLYDVKFIFEDDPKVITFLKKMKLPVVPILSGYYDWQVPR